MRCTRCGGELSVICEGALHLDRCDGCTALFFDAGELDAHLRHPIEAPLADALERGAPSGPCPLCSAATRLLRQGEAELHGCSGCGGVLVHGHLGALAPKRGSSRGDGAEEALESALELSVAVGPGVFGGIGRLLGEALEVVGAIIGSAAESA